jgi:hypothetical protein
MITLAFLRKNIVKIERKHIDFMIVLHYCEIIDSLFLLSFISFKLNIVGIYA